MLKILELPTKNVYLVLAIIAVLHDIVHQFFLRIYIQFLYSMNKMPTIVMNQEYFERISSSLLNIQLHPLTLCLKSIFLVDITSISEIGH